MKKSIVGIITVLVALAWASTPSEESGWDDSYREHFDFVIMVDDEVVAALSSNSITIGGASGSSGTSGMGSSSSAFTSVFVFSEQFVNWLMSDGETELILVMERAQPGSENNHRAVLEGCTIKEFEPLGLIGDGEHPEVLRCSFKVGYTNVELGQF